MTIAQISSLALFPLLAPLSLLFVSLLALGQPGPNPTRVMLAARAASLLALLTAGASAVLLAVHGPLTSPLLGVGGWGLSVRLDALSAVMFALVAFLGGAVLRFSRSYLDGDARHGVFLGNLAFTVACVMLLVLAGNLGQLTAMWLSTSFALHTLLLFYPDRRNAVIAARKKFIVARLGDAALVVAAVLLYRAFGTADLGTLTQLAASALEAGTVPAGVVTAAVLVALTAALKSAQFPTHGWLAEVMETPTPVSALLHAGILNGGTFLIARLGEVMLLSPAALHLLIVIGGVTAVFASVVMITQTSVKVSLAYSSAAHMGFMLLLCGLGAYPVAILHLVAHSFYKAHAFLSSGSVVETARASLVPGTRAVPTMTSLLTGLALSVLTVWGVGSLVGMVAGGSLVESPVSLGLAAMLAIAMTQLYGQGVTGRLDAGVFGRTVFAAAAVSLAFYGLELGASALLGNAVPMAITADALTVTLMTLIVIAFAVVTSVQLLLPGIHTSPRLATLYVHVRNGFYANARFDRLVGALRAPLARP